MEHLEETPNLSNADSTFGAETGIANLIEAAELLRRNKVSPYHSYSETFFSAAKQFLV